VTTLRTALPLALLAAPAALAAQVVGVPAPPPRPAPAAVVAAADSADSTRPRPWRADTAAVIQRLDIQAWVDSAAPALSRAPRPAPAVTTPVPRAQPTPPPPMAAPSGGTTPPPRRPSSEAGRRPQG
jgi:hypothetical protein